MKFQNLEGSNSKSEIYKLEQKVRNLRKETSKIEGIKDALLNQEQDLIQSVGRAKGRLLLKPKVDAFLEDMQTELHQRSVGTYETLLTAIANDVLSSEKPIGLELYTERGLPALDIFIDAGNGNKEDIVNGAGGSMTNVISLGLRMIATVKSGMRKFVALDEPDCWVSPKRVPSFYNVINGLSNKLKLQSFVISHHSMDLLPDEFSIVELKKDEDGNVYCISDPVRYKWSDEEIGIRRLKLINFMSHKNTEVFLHPGVTAVIGENHLGKSVFVRALRSLAYGESSDSDISHGEKRLEVEIEIENGKVIRFTREKKRNPINEWTLEDSQGNVLFNDENSTEFRTGGRGVPDWVIKTLKIDKFEGFDHQLSHQKFPVFLLGEGPSKRASVLAIGKESGYIQNMIVIHKEKCKEDASIVRDGEKKVYEIQTKLANLNGISQLSTEIQEFEDKISLFKNDTDRYQGMIATIQRLEELHKKILAKQPLLNTVSSVPESVPDYKSMISEEEKILEYGKRLKSILNTIEQKKLSLNMLSNLPHEEVKVENIEPLHLSIEGMSKLLKMKHEKNKKLMELEENIANNDKHMEDLISELGGVCPLCEHAIHSKDDFIRGHM